MKKYKIFSILSVLIMPTIVFASSGNDELSIFTAIMIEAFVSIHMSLFVLKPLSEIISKGNSKETFIGLFIARIIILLIFDLFITPYIAVFDFIFLFIGFIVILPMISGITRVKNGLVMQKIDDKSVQTPKCEKCGLVLKDTDNYCINCGTKVNKKEIVNQNDFDPIYNNTEEKLLEEFINKELSKNGSINNNLIPSDVLRRKNILNIIFSILVFVFISLIFFHFPIYTYIIGIIILIIFLKKSMKYNLIKYLVKEIKSRPSEKISNIILNTKNSLVNNNSKVLRIASIIIAIILPLIIFINPKIMYEKKDNGYAVRFYTFGLTNYKSATIPETHNGKPVISLRGNTFSNMPFLENVTLPDTITEIRGQAFKNDKNLKIVNIPKKLEYLGGGSFYNCTSITNIELPDTLTYMGGETFYNATSLNTVKLSDNLTEIRGDSFEYCTSLMSIKIPDKVTRIGGHAFYGDYSLSHVAINENSSLNEIGSSAFRMCSNLYTITLPKNTYVNERAFKESPTQISYYGEEEIEYTPYNYYN